MEPRIAAAIRVMEAHIDEPITIFQISSKIELSVRMLESLFSETLQISPGKYYRQLRLQAASRLMIETRISLQEVAVRTGFNSLTAFSRAFKNHFGNSPGKWRKLSSR